MVERLQRWRGCRVRDVWIDTTMSSRASRHFLPEQEYHDVLGQGITGVHRRGKHIVFTTSSGAILAHNAMSGYWDSLDRPWTFDYVEGKREIDATKDVRVMLKLESPVSWEAGEYTLRYHDARMFGSVHYVDPTGLATKISSLGPDAIATRHMYEPTAVLDYDHLEKIMRSKRTVKEVLMDQGKVAGIGNIYAVEACYKAGILPHRIASTLVDREIASLLTAIDIVLKRAMTLGLRYDEYLHVYRRKNCDVGHPIVSGELKGRTSYWCQACQD
jgi:formamidopyrimidine-DNA glycosylase